MNNKTIGLLCILIALCIVIHHIYKHTEKQFPERAFSLKDISNHETWVVVFLIVGLLMIYSPHSYTIA